MCGIPDTTLGPKIPILAYTVGTRELEGTLCQYGYPSVVEVERIILTGMYQPLTKVSLILQSMVNGWYIPVKIILSSSTTITTLGYP